MMTSKSKFELLQTLSTKQRGTDNWRGAVRRHADARRTLRGLLAQHLKPHPVR